MGMYIIYSFFFLFFFFECELIQGQTKVWKRNFSFFGGSYRGSIISQAWILNFSLVSTRPWVPIRTSAPAIINATTTEGVVWCRPLHQWGGTARHVERKATRKFALRTCVSGRRDGGRQQVNLKWADMSWQREDGWWQGRGSERHTDSG